MEHWLKSRGCIVSSSKVSLTQKVTHYSMRGGRVGQISISDNNALDFLEEMGKAFQRKQAMHWAEKRSLVFKLFVDIDLKTDAIDVSRVVDMLQDVVMQCFPDELAPEAIVCTPYANLYDNFNRVPNQNGAHVTWPAILVDSQTALAVRQQWLLRMQEKMPVPELGWAKVLDESVYTTNGLRMVGCYKKDLTSCVYLPTTRVSGDTQVSAICPKHFLSNVVSYLKATSIRAAAGTQPSACALSLTPDPAPPPKRAKGAAVMDITNQEFLFDSMRNVLPRYWKDAKLTLCKTGFTRGMPWWHVKSNSRFCTNINREHKSNCVWFVVTPIDIKQRCFCPCSTMHQRIYCKCKDFLSKGIRFPPALKQKMMQL